MKRTLFVAASAFIAVSAARAAEPIGIPACDDFITKYEACVSTKVPAAQQSTFRMSLDQMRSSWAGLAKMPEAKPQLEASCKASMEQMKPALAPHGCTF